MTNEFKLNKVLAVDIDPTADITAQGYEGKKHDYIVTPLTPAQGGGYTLDVYTYGGSDADGRYFEEDFEKAVEHIRYFEGLE